ncbi:hypothetical protein [Thermodesulfovibrio sp.]|uniref:hypothetical protein n=1 Tax=Thermodesulfovibrio sp. TaxID=2067987 RepID=UPI0030A33D5C
MRKGTLIFIIFSIIFLLNPSSLKAQDAVYFSKTLDFYEKKIIPGFVPSNAQKSFYDKNTKDTKGELSFRWQESACPIELSYRRYSENVNFFYGIPNINNGNDAAYLEVIAGEKVLKQLCIGEIIENKGYPDSLISNARKMCMPLSPEPKINISNEFKKIKVEPFNYIFIYAKPEAATLNNASAALSGHYRNMAVFLRVGPCKNFNVEQVARKYGLEALNKLMGTNISIEKPEEKVKKEQPKQEEIPVRVIAMPSAAGDEMWSIAYLPATNKLPAKIIAETKPNTKVTFHIVKSPKDAYLVIGNKKGVTIETKSDNKGIAEALFYYNGGKVTQPKKYEIKVSTGEERDFATVNVGLGLAFDKIKAVQGAYGDRHPFTLSLVSKHFPKLNLGLYFSSASRKVWNGQTVGVRLKPQWVNKPANLPADKVFNGITKITPVMASSGGNNVLTVLSYDSGEETVYNITKYAYPAVKMMSEGIHNYRITGELVLTDEEGRDLGRIDETLLQSDALAVLSKEMPEHFMVSLVCALEAQDTDQFLMLEYIKKIPVHGKYVDELLNVMGILCKFGKADYEGLFYDLNNYLGGKWIDHLTSPKVFEKLTPRQQKAAQWAKAIFEREQDIKNRREYGERDVPSYGRLWIAVKPDHELKKLTLDPWLIAPALIDFERGEEEVKKMEEREQKNKSIEAKFNNENLKKAEEMKQQQNTQTQQGSDNTGDNVFEKAINELKDAFKKIFK